MYYAMHNILLVLLLSEYVFVFRGEAGEVTSKKDFIQTARLIAKESEEVVKMAKKVADACTDKRMKRVRALVYMYIYNTVCQNFIFHCP